MRFLLIDLGSDGIVYATDSPIVANSLKQGFTDVSLRPIFPTHANFSKLTHDSVKQNSFTMNDHTNTANINETPLASYLEIKRLCYLRERLMIFLLNSAKANIGKTVLYPYSDITSLVKVELLKGAESEAIAEYAAISGIDFETARSELTVMLDSETQVKIRMMALVNKHTRLINKITRQGEFDDAIAAMNLDFYKSSWL
jgi:hypothetical protein